MARKLTFEEAARRVAEKFGERGVTLVEFEAAERPCVVYCPVHGNQVVQRFSSMDKTSKVGCPACADIEAATKLHKANASRKLSTNISGSNNNVVQPNFF